MFNYKKFIHLRKLRKVNELLDQEIDKLLLERLEKENHLLRNMITIQLILFDIGLGLILFLD